MKTVTLFLAVILLASCQVNSRASNYYKAKEKSTEAFHKGSYGKCNRYK